MVVEPPMKQHFPRFYWPIGLTTKIRSRLKLKPPKALAVSDTKGKDDLGYEFNQLMVDGILVVIRIVNVGGYSIGKKAILHDLRRDESLKWSSKLKETKRVKRRFFKWRRPVRFRGNSSSRRDVDMDGQLWRTALMRVGGEFIRLFPWYCSFEMGKMFGQKRWGGVNATCVNQLLVVEDLVRSQIHGRWIF